MARKLKAKAKPATRRLGRSLLNNLIVDLVQRIDRHVAIADAIAKEAGPKGHDLVGAVPKLTMIELAMDQHLRGMRDIRAFAELIRDRAVAS
jgi:hypothetical protein